MAIVIPGLTGATGRCPELYPEHGRRVVEWAPGGSCTPGAFVLEEVAPQTIEGEFANKGISPLPFS